MSMLSLNTSIPSSEVKNLLTRAIEGKIFKTEFTTTLKEYLVEHNTQVTARFECDVQDTFLDFGLHQRGPCSIVEKGPASQGPTSPTQGAAPAGPSVFSAVTSIIITNNSKDKSLFFRIDPLETQKNVKYEVSIEPMQGKIKKGGKTQEITIKLRVYCTTRILQLGKLFFSYSDMKSTKKSILKKKSTPLTENAESNFCWLSFIIESELSSTIDYEEIELGELVSKGDYGYLYKGSWRNNQISVTQLDNNKIPESHKKELRNQIRQLSKLNNHYLTAHIGTTLILPGNPFCVIYEQVNGISLRKVVENYPLGLEEKFKTKIALDAAKGIAGLHSIYITHRDIRLENIMVVSSSANVPVNAKLVNVSFVYQTINRPNVTETNYESFSMTSGGNSNDPLPVTTNSNNTSKLTDQKKYVEKIVYYSPELFLSDSDPKLMDKVDIYAFGVVLWAIFAGKEPSWEPFKIKNDMTAFEFAKSVVNKNWRLSNLHSFHPIIDKLISKCTETDPNKRCEIGEIVKTLETLYQSIPESSDDYKLDIHHPGGSIVGSPVLGPPLPSPPIIGNDVNDNGNDNHEKKSKKEKKDKKEKRISSSSVNSTSSGSLDITPIKDNGVTNKSSSSNNNNNSNSSNKNAGVPVTSNKKTPSNLVETAWFGEISRDAAENLLRGRPEGTFLTRWSATTSSYVLSYFTGKEFKHIAGILPTEDSETVTVVRVDSVVLTYRNLLEYISSMKQAKCITVPLINPAHHQHDNYASVPIGIGERPK